jgi:HD superfamily phosphohydrolase YqeK
VVGPRRLAHIERVTALLDEWAREMGLPHDEACAWHDAGRWHDALRDAEVADLSTWAGTDASLPGHVLHGPAAAARLAADGEQRHEVLEAIRWHTLGSPEWGRVGRALYLADFLEPGRAFAADERAAIREMVPRAFDVCLRRVVQWRLEWALRDGKLLFPQTVALWNAVR